jgi:hypothetical protein
MSSAISITLFYRVRGGPCPASVDYLSEMEECQLLAAAAPAVADAITVAF